jgi:hypothetical protein
VAQTAEVNWGPLSLVIAAGSPNRCTQPEKRAATQSAADVAETGTASGHLVVLSTIVNKCVQPAELGRGPTKSMCRCVKRRRAMALGYVLAAISRASVSSLAGSPCRHVPPPLCPSPSWASRRMP